MNCFDDGHCIDSQNQRLYNGRDTFGAWYNHGYK